MEFKWVIPGSVAGAVSYSPLVPQPGARQKPEHNITWWSIVKWLQPLQKEKKDTTSWPEISMGKACAKTTRVVSKINSVDYVREPRGNSPLTVKKSKQKKLCKKKTTLEACPAICNPKCTRKDKNCFKINDDNPTTAANCISTTNGLLNTA